jgi:tetratricopeptide (TPR) repeat protein
MKLRASDPQNTLTADTAGQYVAYWRDVAQQLPTAPDAADGNYVAHTYAHMAEAQANLFASQNLNEQAEQTYRIANTMWPDSAEVLGGLSKLLASEGRLNEANQLLDGFVQKYPKQQTAVETIRGSITIPVLKSAD